LGQTQVVKKENLKKEKVQHRPISGCTDRPILHRPSAQTDMP